MLLLLSIIFALMLGNYYTKQTVIQLEQTYAQFVETNNHFTGNLAVEHSALGDPLKFTKLQRNYKELYNRCNSCHNSRPSEILLARDTILLSLHNNKIAGVKLRKIVNTRLNELNEGVRYIHEHHIATLKNFIVRNQIREKAYQSASVQRKNSARSAPELDIIQQTVVIQHALSDIIQIFYILKDSHLPLLLEETLVHPTKAYFVS